MSTERVAVDKAIADEFAAKLAAKAATLRAMARVHLEVRLGPA